MPRKGQRMSAEQKEKIRHTWFSSEGMKGSKNVNYGITGASHPCWKDEKRKPFTKQIRQLFEYRQWRSDIFTRDNYTCVLCGDRNFNGHGGTVYIEADHFPKRFSTILIEYNIKTLDDARNCQELWNINNGRTLCKKCHDPTRGRLKFN